MKTYKSFDSFVKVMNLENIPILNWYCNPNYFVMYQGAKRKELNFGQTGQVFLTHNKTFFMPHTDTNTLENKVFEVNREDVAGEDECFEVIEDEEIKELI